jgi:hypothetical protein
MSLQLGFADIAVSVLRVAKTFPSVVAVVAVAAPGLASNLRGRGTAVASADGGSRPWHPCERRATAYRSTDEAPPSALAFRTSATSAS